MAKKNQQPQSSQKKTNVYPRTRMISRNQTKEFIEEQKRKIREAGYPITKETMIRQLNGTLDELASEPGYFKSTESNPIELSDPSDSGLNPDIPEQNSDVSESSWRARYVPNLLTQISSYQAEQVQYEPVERNDEPLDVTLTRPTLPIQDDVVYNVFGVAMLGSFIMTMLRIRALPPHPFGCTGEQMIYGVRRRGPKRQ